jgi:nucleotide-binding universal stress UspA family protein
MYKHILIATDGSELAGRAVEPALMLPIDEYERAAKENADRILSAVSSAADEAGVECETVHVNDFPAEGIIETAKAKGCDLIVMASHGRRGLSKLLLGSQASRVLTLSEVPVLVCR